MAATESGPRTAAIVSRTIYAGVALVALATLTFEILLTRIFSVTMWYHFAFMAISIAMLGMSVGAIVVYLFPRVFTPERTLSHMALAALGQAISMPVGLVVHASTQFLFDRNLAGLYSLTVTYSALAAPFCLGGICVTLALTRFPQRVGTLYAADLAGAALGCVLVLGLLDVTDAPSAVFAAGFVAALGALSFALGAGRPLWTRILAGAVCGALLAGSIAHTIAAREQEPFIRFRFIKGYVAPRTLYEKWNSFSRLSVKGDPTQPRAPWGWGMSPMLPREFKVRELALDIDAVAGTPLTAFDGDLSKVEHLKYDITNLAHYLRPNASVLVVGAGGGRDILSALVFGQRAITAVELNDDILEIVNERYGEYTGHLDRDPRVTFVNDEGRSYTARQSRTFDILQISFIDTWAATAAGAFVLSEASLYTVEAWTSFLGHLSPEGILSVSRWYFHERPGEAYRLTALAGTALRRIGAKDPRRHIVLARSIHQSEFGAAPQGVATILVSRAPFSASDLATLEAVAARLQFGLVLTPSFALDDIFAALAVGEDRNAVTAEFPLDISPPTDDRPFFFHMLRLRDVLNRDRWRQGLLSFNMEAVFVLGFLLVVVVLLDAILIFGPLIITAAPGVLRGAGTFLVFFAAIGSGFMLIEVAQMQRLILFLGHPVYALSVVLFALFLASGLGSFSTQRLRTETLQDAVSRRFRWLIGCVILVGVLTPEIVRSFAGASTAVRILVAVVLLLVMGFFMGMPFPLGMRLAHGASPNLTAWLWGVNGAASVLASVLAVVISLQAGITVTFWTGAGCYLIAALVLRCRTAPKLPPLPKTGDVHP